jgi:uncharacterized protein Yka (UPF0111/DUF47 family)
MAGKTTIVDELGERELLLPELINEALAANDRAKYFMTLLQTARHWADDPGNGASNLKQERLACGVSVSDYDTVVERSRKLGPNVYEIPESAHIETEIVDNIRRMLAPLQVEEAIPSVNVTEYERRLASLTQDNELPAENQMLPTRIDRITSGQRNKHDSLHLLVMDLHKELNRLQQQIASESIHGASVYGIEEADRRWIAAFMTGLQETAMLKFDHPGLGTTATRTGKRLVLQNDIGTTDAHVLVVHVEPPTATVVYTDVHIERLVFFQTMLKNVAVHWEDLRSRRSAKLQGGLYHLCRGIYTAANEEDLEAYLRFLGSRVVFLIDWNRARKRLRKLASKKVCLDVLQWSAENNCGHMGFLKLGGESLIIDALQLTAKVPLQLGGQLSDILGPGKVAEFLKFTLKTAAEGLLARHSELLIRDEIRAELRNYMDTVHQGLLEIAAEHASLIVELAMAVRDGILHGHHAEEEDHLPRLAGRAKRWEHRADELVSKARTACGQRGDSQAIAELLRTADDIADELEESVFLLTLLPPDQLGPTAFASLKEQSDLVVQGAQEYLKAVENARTIHRSSPRTLIRDFLEAIDRTGAIEHETDDAHRRAKAGILQFPGDFRQLQLFLELAESLEEAADGMMHSALLLKDYIMTEVISQ